MGFKHRKSVTLQLAQTARAYRTRMGVHLGRLGLHPGQEAVLKALAEQDGQAMSALAASLAVQPPTVTKMIARLGAQGFVTRKTTEGDGRQARIFLTEAGREVVGGVDAVWKQLEKEALSGFDDKDRKKIRKLLKLMERNLHPNAASTEAESLKEEAAPGDLPAGEELVEGSTE